LFLRTSSASALRQNAARVISRLQSNSRCAARRNEGAQVWLQTWHLRSDNILTPLYASCKTRGVSHRLTRNLGVLVRRERLRMNSMKLPQWRPSLPADAAEYQRFYEVKQFAAMY
ncbi:hypothetical protein B0H14DRAFT_2730638, partial [Mycena olivaceomarginata]